MPPSLQLHTAQVCSISNVWLDPTSIMHFSTLVQFEDFLSISHFWQFPGKVRILSVLLVVLHQKFLWLIHLYWNVKSLYSDVLSQDSWRPDACRRSGLTAQYTASAWSEHSNDLMLPNLTLMLWFGWDAGKEAHCHFFGQMRGGKEQNR